MGAEIKSGSPGNVRNSPTFPGFLPQIIYCTGVHEWHIPAGTWRELSDGAW